MSQKGSAPSWHVPGDPAATIQNALASGTAREQIVSLLAEQEFEDLPEVRVEAIVETTPDDATEDGFDLPLSQPPSVDASPRGPTARSVSVRDLEYLSRREAGRVVGLALEQFDGNTVRPATNQATEVGLFWRRQHMSVGIRTVPVVDERVDVDHVTTVLEGPLATTNVQKPSEVAVVTNGEFTDAAVSEASDHDVHLFDEGHVRAWFRRARLPLSSIGTVLENGEGHDGPLSDLVDVDPIPTPRRDVDPLAVERLHDTITTEPDRDETPDQQAGESAPKGDEERESEPASDRSPDVGQPPAGQTGTLYVDSDEDDEHDAFDGFVEGL